MKPVPSSSRRPNRDSPPNDPRTSTCGRMFFRWPGLWVKIGELPVDGDGVRLLAIECVTARALGLFRVVVGRR